MGMSEISVLPTVITTAFVFVFTRRTRVSVTVPLLESAGADLGCTPSLEDGAALLVLAPGDVVICSATLELTQADIEGALLSGTVLAKGEASDGQTVQAEKYLEQDLRQEVGLSVGTTKRNRP